MSDAADLQSVSFPRHFNGLGLQAYQDKAKTGGERDTPQKGTKMPRRIQLKRTKGWRKPFQTVVVSRPSRWGNPYKVGTPGIPDAGVATYRFKLWLESTVEGRALSAQARNYLAGKDLACWCGLNQDCHADVLLQVANATPQKGQTDE